MTGLQGLPRELNESTSSFEDSSQSARTGKSKEEILRETG